MREKEGNIITWFSYTNYTSTHKYKIHTNINTYSYVQFICDCVGREAYMKELRTDDDSTFTNYTCIGMKRRMRKPFDEREREKNRM